MILNPNLSFQNVMQAAIHAAEMEEVERRIANSSSANAEDIVEPRHGRWVWKHRTGKDECGNVHTIQVDMTYECAEPYCSECGELCDNSGSLNYCPNCGARMDGGQEE